MKKKKLFNRIEIILLSVLVILGAVLRIYHLDTGLWFDEISTLVNSIRPGIWKIMTHFPGNNDHVLYSLMAHVSVTAFGEHPWSIRLPAMIFGLASIPMLYLLGTTVTSRFEAMLVTTILTVSYHHIWFSQDARGYTTLLFFVLLATFLLLQWFLKNRNSLTGAYAVVAALGSYTHLTMVFIVVCHALICAWVLLIHRNSRDNPQDWRYIAAAFVAAGMLTIILYAPIMLDVHSFFTESPLSNNKVATPFWALRSAIGGLQAGFGAVWFVALGGIFFAAGCLSYWKRQRVVFYLFVLPAPLTILLAIAMGRPIFPRFIFFSVGFGLLIVVRGAAVIGGWMARHVGAYVPAQISGMAMAMLLTIAAVGFSIQSLPYGYRYPKQDYAQAVEFVVQSKRDGDQVGVIFNTSEKPIVRYLGKPWRPVDRVEDLREIRSEGHESWLIYTFPEYIQLQAPGLWEMIHSDCSRMGRFEGTVAGGDINVFRCPPLEREGL